MPTTKTLEEISSLMLSRYIGLPPLMRLAFEGGDLKPLGSRLIEEAKSRPDEAHLLMNLSLVLMLTGHRDLGVSAQLQALAMSRIYRFTAPDSDTSCRVLAVYAAGDLMANTPIEFLLENSDIELLLIYVDPDHPLPAVLPQHDAIFVAIGESDENQILLDQLNERLVSHYRPVINAPSQIGRLGRDTSSALLTDVPGISMPCARRAARDHLLERCKQIGFPTLVRPIGSHAGQDLVKCDDESGIDNYLTQNTHATFYVSPFVDYRSADGLFRKYRIVLIEGAPYLCHMAISSHWMVHYLNAGMLDSADKRAEEARAMQDFDTGFAARHADAFKVLQEKFALDYVGLDCSELQDGRLVIFEIDSDMIVHALDPVDIFPYKQVPMRKVFDAFQQMLRTRITQSKEFEGT